ncbi:ssDNA endodeoxyribonuclease [Quaeritorhiza haematococci]|nr:ssDNA endodeoxyribonuclease [Quaeritorhiza haematococci]
MDGSELVLMLEDNGVVTVCRFTTFDVEALSGLDETFREHGLVNRVIMRSEWLKDAFGELDGTSEKVSLLVSPNAPHFRLSASGLTGDSQMDYPKDSDVLESFSCTRKMTAGYRFSHLQPSLKALGMSNKVSIRMNERGFLAMQYMLPTGENQVNFVEFLFSPLVDEDEDEEEEIQVDRRTR